MRDKAVTGCGSDGRALPWGGRGRKFKSCHSDQNSVEISRFLHYFFAFLAELYILMLERGL